MLFPQPLTHLSLLEEFSVSFLQKTTELLMNIFTYVAVQCDLKPSTGPSDSPWEM